MMSYIKLHLDALGAYKSLSDAEFGRAIRAVLMTVQGEQPEPLSGKDSVMFDALCTQIERDRKSYDVKAEAARNNGKSGGRPRKTEKTDIGFSKPEKTDIGKTKPEKTEKKLRERERVYNNPPIVPPLIGEDEAAEVAAEIDEVLAAAINAGFPDTGANMDAFTDLVAQYGKDAVLHAIGEAVNGNAINLRYVRKVLENSTASLPEEAPEHIEVRPTGRTKKYTFSSGGKSWTEEVAEVEAVGHPAQP